MKSRTPSVVTLHDFIPYRFFKPKTALFQYYRHYVPLVLKQSKHVICVSEATANDAIEFCGIEAKKMTVNPET